MSTALPTAGAHPFDEFLDDFYAECDEHLTLIRRELLALEAFVRQPRVDRALLDNLFRGFHSLKGLAAMVGVVEVEQLAHQMESFLRFLRQEQVVLADESLEALIVGTRLLEQAVAARRMSQPPPDIGAALARLAALAPEEAPAEPARAAARPEPHAPAPGLTPEEHARLAAARARGDEIWEISFVPSPALAERDVNVNTVRARLQASGELIRAIPRVTGPSGLAFEFLLAAGPGALGDWEDSGITQKPYAPPTAAPAIGAAYHAGAASAPAAPANVVRVDLERLDDLMQMVGELIVSRARLEDQLARLEPRCSVAEWRALQDASLALERQLRGLRAGVMRARLVPIGDVFARMQFVVRDLAHELRKQVALELRGQDTAIDKYVVERMLDPLLHLVRNAVGHGLETADERVARGKPPAGTIALRAAAAGDVVTIEVEDDGRGVDADRVAARARALGLIDDAAPLDAERLLQLLCAPGFSTRAEADRVSGRGVGMNVVQRTVHELGGTLSLATQPGRGARFTIQVPLTLAVADAVLAAVGGRTFAVPLPTVREIIRIEPGQITPLERGEVMFHRGVALPLVRLARRFGLPEAAGGGRYAFVIGGGRGAVGLVVDELLGKREIVVRPIGDRLARVSGISGATELADGRLALILDTAALARET